METFRRILGLCNARKFPHLNLLLSYLAEKYKRPLSKLHKLFCVLLGIFFILQVLSDNYKAQDRTVFLYLDNALHL